MSVVTNALNGLDGNTDDYSCEKCNETFTSKELRDKHQLNNHFDCKGTHSTDQSQFDDLF